MKIPLLDLAAQHEPLKKELIKAFERVLDSHRFILGSELEGFETELSSYLGVGYALGVGNGTDALTLALRALGIGPKDGVITTSFSFIATAEVIANLGAHPFFCDIDPETFNLSPDSVESFIDRECEIRLGQLIHTASGLRIKAILPVHLFGQAAAMDELGVIAQRCGLAIVEDAAQSLGAEYKGARVGGIGKLGCFSFYPSKNLSCLGDGGAVTTNDPELAQRIRRLRVHGATKKYHHQFLGYNSRLDEVQAALLRVKFSHLDRWNESRRLHARYYDERLSSVVLTPRALAHNRHIYNQYTIRTQRRDELKSWLAEKGISSEVHYPLPLPFQPAFASLGYKPGDFPAAEAAAREVLSLPIYPEITQTQQDFVIETITQFFT
jgi:dTDP-4-amino-4,6-dideoxygalactose transaminase